MRLEREAAARSRRLLQTLKRTWSSFPSATESHWRVGGRGDMIRFASVMW